MFYVRNYKYSIERGGDTLYVRPGFNYVRGLRSEVALRIVAAREERAFVSLRDLIRHVPDLNKKEIAALAEIGALNHLPMEKADRHRSGATWQASAAAQPRGPLRRSRQQRLIRRRWDE